MATYDIHFQLVPAEEQTGGRYFTFGFESAVGVRGPQKLINRWLKCLLTPKGSDPSDKAYGTGFYGLLGSNITTQQDVVDALTLFIEDCNTQMRAMDRQRLAADDERLQSATLTRVVQIDESGYEAYVLIRNTANQSLTVQLPAF